MRRSPPSVPLEQKGPPLAEYTDSVTADVLGTARGVLLGLALLAGFGLSAAALARGFLAGARLSVRFCGFLLCVTWLSTAAFHLLAAVGLFRLWAALVLAAAGAAAAVRWLRADPLRGEGLHADARSFASAALAIGKSVPFLSTLAVFLAFMRLFRGLAAPPLAWDMLTYHLVKVARWIRTGGLAPELAPDRWDGYEYFPYGGDALWAWAMLPFHGDAPLAAASVLVWLAALISAYALAVELGASTRSAAIGALALALNPASASFLASGYVENTSLFLFLAGSLFAVRVLKGTALPAEPALAAGAFALGAGVKMSGLPILALALGVLASALVLLKRLRPSAPALILAALAVLAGLPPYARALADRGSLLYPQALRVAGRTFDPGHPITDQAHSGTLVPSMGVFDAKAFARELLVRRPDSDFLNPGWGGVVLAGLGVAGLVALVRRGSPGIAAFLAAEAALTLALLFSPDALALRTWWASIIGRFMLPALGVCTVAAAATNHAAVRAGLGLAALVGLWGALPHGLSLEDFVAASAVAGVLVGGAALAGIVAFHAGRRSGPAAGALAGTGVLFVAGALWGAIRAQARPLIWRAAYEQRAFDLHPFASYGSAHVLWQALDDGVPHRIAVSAGWSPPGDNWFRYPFFGRRLQNDVVYIPVTADGSIVETRLAASSGRLSREAWVRRLVERGVDVVVLLAPEPPEAAWVRALPAAFEPFARSPDGLNAAFRIRGAAARAWLAQAPGSPAP
jgi:hypothetical protein